MARSEYVLSVMRVLFLIPMCREECIIAQRATISMRVFFLMPVRREWRLAVGWYVLTMMRVLFLIPVRQKKGRAEVGTHIP